MIPQEEPIERFSGFPEGEVRVTPLPNAFFSQVLPRIDSLAEAKVTLHLWWLLRSRKRGYVVLKELLEDQLLLKGLEGEERPPRELAKEGLERALARGTFLRVDREDGAWLFINDGDGRRAAAQARWDGEGWEKAEVISADLGKDRPNIFALYEQNIGLLQPLIVEELREAEESYPASWIQEAFRIAVERNARNWRYIRAILERWRRDGKDDGAGWDRRRRYIEGEFADYIEH